MSYHQSFVTKTNRLLEPALQGNRSVKLPAKFIRIFITAAVLGVVAMGSFYSPRPGSSHSVEPARLSVVKAPSMLWQETIATFAADCVTPKSSFFLGETVCAQTDGVDLGFPGGRWVNWIRQDLSIAFGSSTTTLITVNPQTFVFTPDQTGTWKVTIAETGDPSQTPAVFTVSTGPDSIATYESTCSLTKNQFNTGDTVCAKADANFIGSRFIYWVNSQGAAVQTDVITSTNPSATRAMTVAGNYWVYFSDSDGSLRSRHGFTVSDPAQPRVDLAVSKSKKPGDVVAGGFINYQITVINRGPDAASSVELTDPATQNLTYVSSTQDDGPAFTQDTGTPTTWRLASLPANQSAMFTFVYQVGSVATGTELTNTANVSSTTTEIHFPDNSSTDVATVISGSPGTDCSLDCPNDIVTTATVHGQNGGANVNFGNAEGFGSCGTITANPTSGSFFPIGTTQVVVTSSTGGGGCSFNVTVLDTPAPTILCPANITVTANAGQAAAFVPDPNGSSSSVGTPTTTGTNILVTGTRDDGSALTDAYGLGETLITWTVTEFDIDPQNEAAQPTGRSAHCTQRITVNPNQVLTISCPANLTLNSPTGCDPATISAATLGFPTVNSQTATVTAVRSDGGQISFEPPPPTVIDPFPVGTTTITWTAQDTDGQTKSCTQTVTVTGSDTTPPILTAPPNISIGTSSCSVVLDDELGVADANDPDCGGGPVSVSRTGIPQIACPTPQNPNQTCDSFVFPTGTTVITYTATSAGGTTVRTQTVTVTESPAVPPTITAPNDVTLFTGPGATSCGVTVANLDTTLGTATANDNCPGVVVTRIGVPAGNVFPVGNTTVTYRATDRNGNFADDTQIVTVVDNTLPVVTAPAPVTLFTGPGSTTCSVTVTNLDATLGTGSATDNCPGVGAVIRTGVPAGGVFPEGTTTLTYSATDAHGNTNQATQVVTVIDNTAPVISCPANIVLEPSCPTGAIATWTPPVGTDNCPGATTTQTAGPAPGSVFPIGTTTVTYSVTDAHGNGPVSCSFTVTVKTVVQTIDELKAAVNANQQLNGPQKNGLISKLDAARQHFLNGNQNGACAKLADFVNSVQNFINQGNLSPATGNAWISTANHLRNTIGCTSLPCS